MNEGYNPDGTPRFKTKDPDMRQVERAERIELEKAKNRWSMGRMFKAAQELLARFKWL